MFDDQRVNPGSSFASLVKLRDTRMDMFLKRWLQADWQNGIWRFAVDILFWELIVWNIHRHSDMDRMFVLTSLNILQKSSNWELYYRTDMFVYLDVQIIKESRISKMCGNLWNYHMTDGKKNINPNYFRMRHLTMSDMDSDYWEIPIKNLKLCRWGNHRKIWENPF